MKETLIEKDGASAYIVRGWMAKAEADAFFAQLRDAIPWEQDVIKVYDWTGPVPRKTYRLGDVDVRHGYSGQASLVHDWTSCEGPMGTVRLLRDHLVREMEVSFNAALLNYYHDRDSYIAPHSDKELSPRNPTVVGLSLGGSRDFHFHSKTMKEEKIKTQVHSGDLMVMTGRCQELWTHGVPKRARAEQRISITYRLLD